MSLSSPVGQCIFCQFRNEIRRPCRIAPYLQRPSSYSTCSPLARGTSRQSAKHRRNETPFDAWEKAGQERAGLTRLGSRSGPPSRSQLRGSRGKDNKYRDVIYQNEAIRQSVSSGCLLYFPA